MLLWSLAGVWGEIAASIGTMVLIALMGSWYTLVIYATYAFVVGFTVVGTNDVTPGFFITAGLLALRYRPWLGAVLIAVAAGFKPYAFAWYPGVIGVGGIAGLGSLVVSSVVIWLPILLFSAPVSVLRSFSMAQDVHPVPQNALNFPAARVLAIPVAIGAAFLHKWWMAVASGLAIYLVVLFFDRWASLGYLVAIVPIIGILLEVWVHELARHRARLGSVSGRTPG